MSVIDRNMMNLYDQSELLERRHKSPHLTKQEQDSAYIRSLYYRELFDLVGAEREYWSLRRKLHDWPEDIKAWGVRL